LIVNEGTIAVSQLRRYYQNNWQGKKHLVIALHGYGQLAFYFAKNFTHLNETHALLIPEAGHRFYVEGSAGRVGASWMTKEWREQDIQENLQYLQSLFETVCAAHQFEAVTLLGFSQGGATAARWFEHAPSSFSQLILWASVFPPDVPGFQGAESTRMDFVLGKQDPYFAADQQAIICKNYRDLGFQIHQFEGAHRIDPDCLAKIVR
jgi:predicted esterase